MVSIYNFGDRLKVLNTMAIPFNLSNRDAMIKAAQTSLSSKVIIHSAISIYKKNP